MASGFSLHQLVAADFKLRGLVLSLGEDNDIALRLINIRDEIYNSHSLSGFT